jgi:hypothetical protein
MHTRGQMPSSAAIDSAAPIQIPACSAASPAFNQKSVGSSATPTPWPAAAASSDAAGSKPRLPINTSTCTPNESQAIRKIAASDRW